MIEYIVKYSDGTQTVVFAGTLSSAASKASVGAAARVVSVSER